MIRVNMIVEGQTEEEFAHDVLEMPLAQRSLYLSVRCVETSRDKKRGKIYRGGLLDYNRLRGDLVRWMKEDQKPDARFTTMIDLYALPDNYPEKDRVQTLKIRDRCRQNDSIAFGPNFCSRYSRAD